MFYYGFFIKRFIDMKVNLENPQLDSAAGVHVEGSLRRFDVF